jgi:hypothetical protein
MRMILVVDSHITEGKIIAFVWSHDGIQSTGWILARTSKSHSDFSKTVVAQITTTTTKPFSPKQVGVG